MRIDKRINISKPEPERLIKHLDPIPFWQNALEKPQCKEPMRWMYSEVRDKINQWSSTIQQNKTLPGISSPNSGNDAEPLSGYCTVLLACARFAIQFNRNATFDLQVAGRVSNLNFIAYSFPGCHPWSLKANVSFQKLFVKSLCSVRKIFNLAEHSNQDKLEIIWGGGNLCSTSDRKRANVSTNVCITWMHAWTHIHRHSKNRNVSTAELLHLIKPCMGLIY